VINFENPIYSISEQIAAPFKIPKCDLLFSPFYNVPVFPVKAKKRIVIIHDVYHLAYNDHLKFLQRIYSRVMMYYAAHLSDHIITISMFSKSEILKYQKIDEAKISIIYFGFNFEDYSKIALNYDRVKNKYDLPGKYILFVSNIKPHKNLYNLLMALEIILEKEVELKLLVVGEYSKLITSDTKSFKLLNENPLLRDNTIFTGYIEKEELVLLYKNAAAFIFPSHYEGFGIPPLEAMACGCPVVASNAASIPESCGDAALYINPEDISDIAKKIMTIILNEDVAGKLVLKGKENIKRFSNEVFEKKLNSLLESIL
jgi:glycosyltransferase involved in cell wall biosynthesis